MTIIWIILQKCQLTCAICSRSYVQKRNLKRHKDEKHNANLEYYNCIKVNCRKKFIRRSYLSKHLIFNDGYSSIRGREMACRAPRSNLSETSYYENISEDERIYVRKIRLQLHTPGKIF